MDRLRSRWQGGITGPQRSRHLEKSDAASRALEVGEVPWDGNCSSRKQRKWRPGRLVFLASRVRSSGVAYAAHPHVIVSSGPRKLGGTQAVTGLQLRPLPESADLPLAWYALKDVVGLNVDFERIWRDLVNEGTLLEQALGDAINPTASPAPLTLREREALLMEKESFLIQEK